MMARIFDWCVAVLVYGAGVLGITYKEINVWIFVIIWPLLTIGLIGIIFLQRRTIGKLSKGGEHRTGIEKVARRDHDLPHRDRKRQ